MGNKEINFGLVYLLKLVSCKDKELSINIEPIRGSEEQQVKGLIETLGVLDSLNSELKVENPDSLFRYTNFQFSEYHSDLQLVDIESLPHDTSGCDYNSHIHQAMAENKEKRESFEFTNKSICTFFKDQDWTYHNISELTGLLASIYFYGKQRSFPREYQPCINEALLQAFNFSGISFEGSESIKIRLDEQLRGLNDNQIYTADKLKTLEDSIFESFEMNKSVRVSLSLNELKIRSKLDDSVHALSILAVNNIAAIHSIKRHPSCMSDIVIEFSYNKQSKQSIRKKPILTYITETSEILLNGASMDLTESNKQILITLLKGNGDFVMNQKITVGIAKNAISDLKRAIALHGLSKDLIQNKRSCGYKIDKSHCIVELR